MGMSELIEKVQPDVKVKIERHHISQAMLRGLVKPVRRIGMAFDYSDDSVEGLREYMKGLRPWRRQYREFA